MARILDRSRKGSSVGGGPITPLAFDSSGVSAETSDVADLVKEYPTAMEVGTPELHYYAEAADGQTAEILTVPASTAWRLVGLVHQQTNSADVATRTVTVSMRTAADADIEKLSSATSVASAETEYSFLFGSQDRIGGSDGVAAAGTLVIDNVATATKTIIINGVTFTWIAALTGAANELLINTNEAGTKATLKAAFTDAGRAAANAGLHSVSDAVYASLEMTAVDFSGDNMVFTANVKGTAGNSLTTTETMTGGNNDFAEGTLGTTTAGVDQADVISAEDYPEDSGPLLTAGEDVEIIVTNGEADDDFKGYLFVIALTQDPTT